MKEQEFLFRMIYNMTHLSYLLFEFLKYEHRRKNFLYNLIYLKMPRGFSLTESEKKKQ